MIQQLAEQTGMIGWVSEHVERSITRTVALVRPEINEYITRESASTSDKVADTLKEHMEKSLERRAEKGNLLAKLADKIMDLSEEGKGKMSKVEQKFRAFSKEFVQWIMKRLEDVILALTEFKLRLELDKLPGVRVLGSRSAPLIDFQKKD